MNTNRIIAKIGWAVVLLWIWVSTATAEPLEAGKEYPAGTLVKSASDGIAFKIPNEWIGGLPRGGSAFVLGSRTRAGVGLIIMRASTSNQDLKTLLSGPQDLGDGVILLPTGPLKNTDQGYEISFSNGAYIGHALGRVGSTNNGVVVFFGGPAGQSDYYASLVRGTSDSLQFSKPETSPAQDQWRSLFAGMMLKRMSSYYSGGLDGAYVGGSSSETLHLCSDNSYGYFSSSNVAADGGTGMQYGSNALGSDAAQDYGQWSIEIIGDQATLVLRSNKGGTSAHPIQIVNNTTYVDGEKAYRVKSDRCQ